MAITTDSTIDVGNYITFNIGLSKSIGNYTADEVWNYQYCSSSWDAFRHVCDESYQGYAPGSIEASEFQMPFHFVGFNQAYIPTTYTFEEGQIEYNQGEKGIYGKIIWLCVTGNGSIGNIFGLKRTIENTDGVKIVTEMDMTKVFLFLDTFQDPANNDPMYCNYDNFKIKEDHDGTTTYEHARNASIFPAVMFQYNGKLYIHRIFQNSYTSLDWSWWLAYYGPDQSPEAHTELQGHTFNAQPVCFDDNTKTAYLPINIMRQFSGLRPTTTERFYTPSDIEDVGVRYQWLYGYDGGRICPATETKYLQMASWYGMMFHHNGIYYKPVIKDGYVIGFTDDMTTPSDIDDWTGATNHDVPPAPPTPPKPAPGHWDSIESSGTYSGALRFVRAYYMSGTELSNLKTYMGKTEAQGGPPDGYDLLESIIAIKMYPFALATTASDSVTISLTNPGGTWTEIMRNNFIAQVASAITGQPYPGTEPPQVRIINTGCSGFATDASMRNYDLGSLDMSKFVNDTYPFLTYDATVELYIPFVGTFVLDPQTVMGRTLHCYLNLDPATGGVYGYCYCNHKGTNVMIASGTGNIGIDVPISSAQAGIVQAQTDNIRHQQAAGLITTAAAMALPVIGASAAAGAAAYTEGQILRGIASASEVSRASSAAYRSTFAKELGSKGIAGEAVATTTNALTANRQVKNLVQSHNMAMTGSIGQSVAEWSCPHKAYVKVMRPQVHNPGDNYDHAVAVPAYTSGKLSSYKGLTVCVNPDVSGVTKATPAERNAIVAMLQGGVIV